MLIEQKPVNAKLGILSINQLFPLLPTVTKAAWQILKQMGGEALVFSQTPTNRTKWIAAHSLV